MTQCARIDLSPSQFNAALPADVISAQIHGVRRYRGYHRLEARVTLVLRGDECHPPRRCTILTSVPMSRSRPGLARKRLIASAAMLASVPLPASVPAVRSLNAA